MKKLIYIIGILVILLNILFTISPTEKISIENAQAEVKDIGCVYDDGQVYWGFTGLYISDCVDNENTYCGYSQTCTPAWPEAYCLAFICYLQL